MACRLNKLREKMKREPQKKLTKMSTKQKEILRQNVGIDVSKDKLSVCFYELEKGLAKKIKGSRSFSNTPGGYEELVEWAQKRQVEGLVLGFALEATGVYHENVVYYLSDHGYKVSVLLANQVKSYIASLNIKTKTDKVDAKALGQIGLERDLKAWKAPKAALRQLKQLSRERVSLLEERTMLSNKLHAMKSSYEYNRSSIFRLEGRIAFYDDQVKEVETHIEQVVNQDKELKEKIENICTIKGLGEISVLTILAETNGFELFSSRSQLVSYAGYDVVEKQSGTSVNGKTRISKKGNRFIRRVLHFPAISAARHEPIFKALYERVYDRTKIKMKGLVAVQRKLLIYIYTLYKKNEAFDPQFGSSKV